MYLDVAPPTLQFPFAVELVNRRPIRPTNSPRAGEVPPWIGALGDRPCVYVTLGTTFQAHDVEFFQVVMSALQEEDVDVVVTVGPSDPLALGPVPANARVERFVPQHAVLPACGVVVSNGGAGSTMGALAAGVPLLIVPAIAASQSRNAAAVARCGAGRSLDRGKLSREVVRAEVLLLLDDPTYAQTARAIADEIAAMPAPSEVVPALEALAAGRASADPR